jgi:hypothetical protein
LASTGTSRTSIFFTETQRNPRWLRAGRCVDDGFSGPRRDHAERRVTIDLDRHDHGCRPRARHVHHCEQAAAHLERLSSDAATRELHDLDGPAVLHVGVPQQSVELVRRTLHVASVPERATAHTTSVRGIEAFQNLERPVVIEPCKRHPTRQEARLGLLRRGAKRVFDGKLGVLEVTGLVTRGTALVPAPGNGGELRVSVGRGARGKTAG